MDCLEEFRQIEQWAMGTLRDIGAVIGTIDDPIAQMACARVAIKKYREQCESERMNFNKEESLWRLAQQMCQSQLTEQMNWFQEIIEQWSELHGIPMDGSFFSSKESLHNLSSTTSNHTGKRKAKTGNTSRAVQQGQLGLDLGSGEI